MAPWRLLREIARHSMRGGRCDSLEVVSVILCHTSDYSPCWFREMLWIYFLKGGRGGGGGGWVSSQCAQTSFWGLFFILGSYQLKANYRNRIMLTCSYFLRFILFVCRFL